MTRDEGEKAFAHKGEPAQAQHGALCWRLNAGSVQVLLISSRETGRWIIPKGWPITGLSAQETALREAWEEAGVTGIADPSCLGLYAYEKIMTPDEAVPCIVSVFAVQVTRLHSRFPERKERKRKWYAPRKAATKVEEPALRALLSGFAPPQGCASDQLILTSEPLCPEGP